MYLNLTTVFFLCGLWHGAAWTFVIWGLLHGLFLVAERGGLGRVLSSLPAPVGWAYTLLMVMVGWVFFRAHSVAGAWAMLQAMAGFGAAEPTPYSARWYLTPELLLALVAGAIGSAPVIPALARLVSPRRDDGEAPVLPRAWAVSAVVAVAAILAVSITQVALGAFTPFIYFRF